MQEIKSFNDVCNDYSAFIFDIWGVLHDGTELYPNVINVFKKLQEGGKKVFLLSNAPRRASKAQQALDSFGITQDLYESILTSGEATYKLLAENQKSGFNKFSSKYYYIGPEKDIDLLNGLDYTIGSDASECGFALVTGYDHENSTLDEKDRDLESIITHKLPMICVNPDMIVVKKTGKMQYCAGNIAKRYQELGGEVVYFGKPYGNVYDILFNELSAYGIDSDSVLAVGDGLETDIKGANNNKIDSVFITSGIISNKLGNKYGEMPNHKDIKKECDFYKSCPEYIITNL